MLNFILFGLLLLIGIAACMYKMFTLEVELGASQDSAPELQMEESIAQ